MQYDPVRIMGTVATVGLVQRYLRDRRATSDATVRRRGEKIRKCGRMYRIIDGTTSLRETALLYGVGTMVGLESKK